jgi:hypothetical protein
MHAGLLRRRPTRRVHAGGDARGIGLLPPIYQQGDGVLGLGHASQVPGGAGARGRGDLDGVVVRHHALADVDVVRIQVVGDVAVAAGPGLEGLQLELRLAHVTVEVVEVAQAAGFGAGVRVRRVEALVVLDEDEDAVLARLLEEVQVVRQQLGGRLGDQDVDLALDRVQRDRVVRGVRREDGDGRARCERVDGRLIGLRVGLIVGREGFERDVKALVDV